MRNADEKMQILLVHAQTEAPKSECAVGPQIRTIVKSFC